MLDGAGQRFREGVYARRGQQCDHVEVETVLLSR